MMKKWKHHILTDVFLEIQTLSLTVIQFKTTREERREMDKRGEKGKETVERREENNVSQKRYILKFI